MLRAASGGSGGLWEALGVGGSVTFLVILFALIAAIELYRRRRKP